jgi:hypothetical protein
LRRIDWADRGREGRSDSRTPIAHSKSFHLELGGRDEAVHLAISDPQGGLVEADVDAPEGQLKRAGCRDDFRPVRGEKGIGERPVVDVGREPQAGVEALRRAILGEQERPRVDRRRQVILALRRLEPVQERELGQGEERVEIAPRRDHRLVQISERRFGLFVEGLEQASLEEHVARRRARFAGGHGTLAELAVDGLRIDANRADRIRAGRDEETRDGQKGISRDQSASAFFRRATRRASSAPSCSAAFMSFSSTVTFAILPVNLNGDL